MGDLKPTVVGLSISMAILAFVSVMLRIDARRVKKVALGIDDYLAILALIFSVALSAIILVAVYGGNLGGHMQIDVATQVPLHPDQFVTFSKMLWATQFISIPAAGLNKLSVLFFYRRIFVGNHFRIIVGFMIGLITLWNVSFFFTNLFDCIPIYINWRPELGTSGKCVEIIKLFWAVLISDIVTDAIILVLPWYQIWKLKMSTNRKLQIISIFLLGGFVVCAGIARCVLSMSGVASQDSNFDYTYTRAPPVYWTVVHSCVGVVSSCLPTLRPLISHYHLDSPASSVKNLLSWQSRYSGSRSMVKVGSNPSGGRSASDSELMEMKHGKSEYNAPVARADYQNDYEV